jgi:hypothetical protein
MSLLFVGSVMGGCLRRFIMGVAAQVEEGSSTPWCCETAMEKN